jgi:MtN3 and saliva related transmembrane protein
MAEFISTLGFFAAFLTTTALLPQFYKTWKTKKTRDISLYSYAELSLGTSLWMSYGILINSYPLIIANAVSLVFSSSILFMKLKYKK